MPIDTRRAQLLKQANRVQLSRDFAEGGTAAKKHVTQLPGMKTAVTNGVSEVDLFRGNAYFLESVEMTLDAFAGMIMTPKPSLAEDNDGLQQFVDDLTRGGEPLNRCIARTAKEVLLTGWQFALVDWPLADPEQVKADAQTNNERAYVVFYNFEDLIDFKTRMIGNERRFTQIRMYEGYDVPEDEFSDQHKRQIKVLDLVENPTEEGPALVYRQRIFRQGEREVPAATGGNADLIAQIQTDNANWRQWGDDVYPKRAGQFLEKIPGVFFGPGTLDPVQIDGAPLDKLVNIATSHLQNSALREWSLMWCGATTLVLSGGLEDEVDEEGNEVDAEPIRVGSSEALQLGEGGDAKLLQADKNAVGAITETMKEKQEHMAAAGAMLLTNQVQSNITNETALLMRVGQFATLSDVASTLEEGYTALLTELLDWQGLPMPDDIGLTLNKKYVPAGLKPGELNEIVAGIQSGEVPRGVLVKRLKEAELIDGQMTEDQYKDKLAEERDEFGITQDEPPIDENDDEGEGGEDDES